MPDGRQLVVDVKTPLDAYLSAVEAATDEAAQREVRQWWRANAGRHPEAYEAQVLRDFGSAGGPDLLIVVDRLLTGFDEPRNTVLYIDKPLISGLQPETFASFVGQRSRWCQGMVQILMLKNPLFKRGLSLPQRLSYISSSLFWFFPFVRSVFFVAPLLFILFDIEVVFMYPWAGQFRDLVAQGPAALVSMAGFAGILVIAYAYALKKGALNWKS